jgi:hypothetical protein
MLSGVASRIMPRTTIDIDATVLRELKRRQRAEGRTMGQLASELLASALATSEPSAPPPFRWTTAAMGSRIDLEDKEAVRRALDAR